MDKKRRRDDDKIPPWLLQLREKALTGDDEDVDLFNEHWSSKKIYGSNARILSPNTIEKSLNQDPYWYADDDNWENAFKSEGGVDTGKEKEEEEEDVAMGKIGEEEGEDFFAKSGADAEFNFDFSEEQEPQEKEGKLGGRKKRRTMKKRKRRTLRKKSKRRMMRKRRTTRKR